MRLRIVRVRDSAQAWRIAVLTLIVLVVGCDRSNPPRPPGAKLSAAREAAQRDVREAQAKVDELGARLSRSEAELGKLKEQQRAPADPTADPSATSSKEIAQLEAEIARQRAALELATKELTERNIALQKTQHEAAAKQHAADEK